MTATSGQAQKSADRLRAFFAGQSATPIRCTRCGDEDGPFTPAGMCEDCARVVAS